MSKTVKIIIAVMILTLLTAGCGSPSFSGPDPDKIVPAREVLIENLKDSGYTVKELSAIEGSDLTVDRVSAQRGDSFIDIVYGLSGEEASIIFDTYCGQYEDNYYILARNGNYVYCISDKKTFSKAGFTSTENVGVQYIHN